MGLKKVVKRIYHFLGGIHLAIGLIGTTAILVIVGTFIEARTESHLHASKLTYGSPFFATLLWLFFVNILFSATRRWPFQRHHLPFLITHLGLLMVLGGTIIKNSYGTQGILTVMEGSGSHKITLPGTYALLIEKRDPRNPLTTVKASIPLTLSSLDRLVTPFPELSLKQISFKPHVQETLETWIKQGRADITDPPAWQISAAKTDNLSNALRDHYLQGLSVRFSHIDREWLLSDLLTSPITVGSSRLSGTLQLDYSPINAFEDASLILTWKTDEKVLPQVIKVPLAGYDSLKQINVSHPYLHATPFDIEFHREPGIAFIEDADGDIFLFAFDGNGRFFDQSFRKGELRSFIAYDSGYGGYAVSASVPAETPLPKQRQEAIRHLLSQELQQALETPERLSPPLQMLHGACEKAGEHLPTILPQFLDEWRLNLSLLYPAEKPLSPTLANVMAQLDWSKVSSKERQGCQWTSLLFDQLGPSLFQGESLMTLLRQKKWPLLNHLAENTSSADTQKLLTSLAQQLFAIADTLPNPPKPMSTTPSDQAKLLSAYFKAYGIDYALFDEIGSTLTAVNEQKTLTFETPITVTYESQTPSSKLENNTPLLEFEATNGRSKNKVALAYQPFAAGFKWPILEGQYIVRFQPQSQTIPFHIRLRQARQINYPHSNQPYSYESDLIISRAGDPPIETTLSMNRVYESWDGYRFYLSNISPASEGAMKKVQIVVNHDPAKYFLTYPGASLVSLGIVLLFWLKTGPSKRAKQKFTTRVPKKTKKTQNDTNRIT